MLQWRIINDTVLPTDLFCASIMETIAGLHAAWGKIIMRCVSANHCYTISLQINRLLLHNTDIKHHNVVIALDQINIHAVYRCILVYITCW